MKATPIIIGTLALLALSGRRRTVIPPPPAGDPPPPADFPQRPGGYKAVTQPTAEMSAVAASVLAQHPAVGTMTDFVADDGKTYGAWVTYHLKGGEWVRAVEIWEKV